MEIDAIKELNLLLNKIPGISKKQADKTSNFLLTADENFIKELIEKISNLKKKISFCKRCNYITEDNYCLNCTNKNANSTLMIVENVTNVKKINDLDFFKGYFYVLPYLINLKEKLTKSEKYNYTELIDYINQKDIKEVIIVLSPTLEGEATVSHIMKLLKNKKVKVSRAAIGLPMGSNIDYIDGFTIKQSIKNRNDDY